MATDWGVSRRIAVIKATLEFLARQKGACRGILCGQSVVLDSFDLPEMAGVSLWLVPNDNKEGEMALHLRVAGFEGYVARAIFALEPMADGALALRIACVQGNKAAYETDRKLEKAMHGLRPKALVVFAVQEVCHAWGVSDIFGINSGRHVFARKHAMAKWLGRKVRVFQMDYDAMWSEFDGVPQEDGWFRLPARAPRRTAEEMKPNKRSMYRKRYAFMDETAQKIHAALGAI